MSYLDNFYYRLMGTRGSPRLVFLHGLMGFSSNWQTIARALEEDFEILLYDQRGHGRSFQPESGYAPKDYAQDLRKIFDELAWEKAHVVGHSLGGRAAMSFASEHPERVDRLVVEDIGAEPSWDSMTNTRNMVLNIPVPFASRDDARRYFEEDFAGILKDPSSAPALSAYLMANLSSTPAGGLNWRFSLRGILESLEQGRSQDMWKEWEGIEAPTLLVRGTKSSYLPEPVYTEMLGRQTRASGVEIDAGHWLHSEKPEEFIRVLRDFLTRAEI